MTTETLKAPEGFNPEKKWVRCTRIRDDGMVEFEFAVGDPQLYVELLMTSAAFEEFCEMHRVTPTQANTDKPLEVWDWNLRHARERGAGRAATPNPELRGEHNAD